MPALPPDRTFLLAALVGVLLALAGILLRPAAAGSDAGSLLLGLMATGIALTMFSLVPPAARMLLRGWRSVGIGPRDPAAAARTADGLALVVWAMWLAGAAVALPNAWAPMLAYLGLA